MKKQYIQPQIEAQMLQGTHFTCVSNNGDLIFSNQGGDPNSVDIW